MRFRLSPEPPSPPLLEAGESSGAVVQFTGRVRDFNEGRPVLSLEYEAFDELALREGERILDEAVSRFGLNEAGCIHRTGHLKIGEAAIHVEVASGHRQEAFEACRWIVDEVKARVPIWKREHYADGSTEWLDPTRSGIQGRP